MRKSEVAKAWIDNFRDGGYEPKVRSKKEFKHWKSNHPRVWRMILNRIQLKKSSHIFELGCGEGKQSVRLALRGYRVTGLDCSREVLQRCKKFIKSVEKYNEDNLDIQLQHKDFLFYKEPREEYEMAFSFGVIEHFLRDSERNTVLRKLYNMVKPGGWVITVVPNGIHPMRYKQRSEGLGGYIYKIPEIDYSVVKLQKELEKVGFIKTEVVPYNLFGYLHTMIQNPIMNFFGFLLMIIFRILPKFLIPKEFQEKHAYTLVAFSQKKEGNGSNIHHTDTNERDSTGK